jgi:hypothetical protein
VKHFKAFPLQKYCELKEHWKTHFPENDTETPNSSAADLEIKIEDADLHSV